jgi:hypothetical protein
MPDPAKQYQKTPVRVDIIESAMLPDGDAQTYLSTVETGDNYKTLIDAAQPEIATLTQKHCRLKAN